MKNCKQSVLIGNPQPSRIVAKVPLLMVAIIALGFGFIGCGDSKVEPVIVPCVCKTKAHLGIGEKCTCGGVGCNCTLGIYGIKVTGNLTAGMKENIEAAFEAENFSSTQKAYLKRYFTEIRLVPGATEDDINVSINGTVLIIRGTAAGGTIFRELRNLCTEKGID